GDIYADLSSVDSVVRHCSSAGENTPYSGHDWCVLNASFLGSAVTQAGLLKGNQTATVRYGPFTNVPVSDALYSRHLAQTMYGPVRQESGYVHTVPDGSLITYESCVGDPHLAINGAAHVDQYGCQEFM